MPSDPNDILSSKLMDLNRRRSSDWMRTGIATPVAFDAARQGKDPRAAASQFFPTPQPPPGATDLAQAKLPIINAMAEYQKAKASDELGLAAKLAARGDYVKEALQFASKVGGDVGSTNQAAAASWNTAITNLQKEAQGAVQKRLELALGSAGVAGGTAAAAKIIEASGGDLHSPAAQRMIAAKVKEYAMTGEVGAAAGFQNMMDAELYAQGIDGGVRGIVTGTADNEQSTALLSQVQTVSNQANHDAAIEMDYKMQAAEEQLVKQFTGPGTALSTLKSVLAMKELGGSPEENEKLLEGMLEKTRPTEGDPDALRRYDELLAQIDQDNLPPASNLAEARRRFLADDDFKKWMAENGYATPEVALKELRRKLREKRAQGKAADLAKVRADRLGEGKPAPEVNPGADLVSDGESPKKPAGPQSIKFALDPTNEDVVYIWDGVSLSEATPEELDSLQADLDKAEAAGKYDELWSEMVIPDVGPIKEMVRKQDFDKKFGPPLRTPEPVEPVEPVKPSSPSLGMIAQDVKNVVSRPANTLRTAEQGIRQLFKKKPDTTEEDEAERQRERQRKILEDAEAIRLGEELNPGGEAWK